MSLKRKLLAGAAALLVAGGATGGAIAARSHATLVRTGRAPAFKPTEAGFVRASAWYLGLSVATLRSEVKGGRTIADVANSTAGTSAQKLTAYLVTRASLKLHLVSDRALTPRQTQTLRGWLGRQVTGFLNDTCPLNLSGLQKRLGGCHGMSM